MGRLKKILFIIIGQGLNALTALIMLPYLARSLSKTDYASYGQSLLVVLTISTIGAAIFNKSLYVFLSDQKHHFKNVITGSLSIALFCSIGFTSLVYFAAPSFSQIFGNTDIENCLKIYAFSITPLILYSILNAFLIFHERVKVSSGISVLTNIVKVIALFWVIQYTKSLEYIFWVLLLTATVQFLITFVVVMPTLSIPKRVDLNVGIAQSRLGLPLGMSAMIGTFILQADAFMISTILNQEAYAMYRNGAWEIPLISTIYASISTILLPEITALWKNQKYLLIKNLKAVAILSTACITFPILGYLLLNSENIIVLLFSETYKDSWPVFAIFNLALLVRINDYSDIIISSGQTKLITKYYIITFILNIILNFIFITHFSYVGAAIATLFSLLSLAFLQGRKSITLLKTSINDLFQLKKILLILFLSIATYGAISFCLSMVDISLFMRLLIGAGLYFPLIYYIIIKLGYIHPKIISQIRNGFSFLKK